MWCLVQGPPCNEHHYQHHVGGRALCTSEKTQGGAMTSHLGMAPDSASNLIVDWVGNMDRGPGWGGPLVGPQRSPAGSRDPLWPWPSGLFAAFRKGM